MPYHYKIECIKTEIFQAEIQCALRKTHNRTGLKNGQSRIKIATKVLEEVKTQFPETVEFINDRPEQECQKENMSVDLLLHFQKEKVSVEKFFYLDLV